MGAASSRVCETVGLNMTKEGLPATRDTELSVLLCALSDERNILKFSYINTVQTILQDLGQIGSYLNQKSTNISGDWFKKEIYPFEASI